MDGLKRPDSPLLSWRSVGLDALVLCTLFAGINYFFFPEDIGMFGLNPTPATLLPVFLGLRYGFAVGLSFGVLLSVGILFMRSVAGGGPVEALWEEHRFGWLALPLAGAICGQVFFSVRSAWQRARIYNQHQDSKLRALGADLEYFRQVKDRLERLLLRRETLVFDFDNEIRSLHTVPRESFPSACLQSLNRTERIYSAAAYFREEGDYMLKGTFGDPGKFPSKIGEKDDPMIAAVLTTGTFAALPRFLDEQGGWEEGAGSDFLAVFPLVCSGEFLPSGLIVIEGIPFIQFERNTLRRIDTFCQWVAQIVEQRAEMEDAGARQLSGRPEHIVVPEQVLLRRLRLAAWSYERLQVPYTLLLMKPLCPITTEAFESAMGDSLRGGDTFSQIGGSVNLVVLAPFTGDLAVESIQERVKATWKRSGQQESSLEIRLWNNDVREAGQVLSEVREAAG